MLMTNEDDAIRGFELSAKLLRARARQDRAEYERLLRESDHEAAALALGRLGHIIWGMAVEVFKDEEVAARAIESVADDEEDAMELRIQNMHLDR